MTQIGVGSHTGSGRTLLALPHACFFFAVLAGALVVWAYARWQHIHDLRAQAAAALNFQLAWCGSFLVFGAVGIVVGDDPDPPSLLEQLGGIVFLASIVMLVLGIQQSSAAIGAARSGRLHRYALRPPLFT